MDKATYEVLSLFVETLLISYVYPLIALESITCSYEAILRQAWDEPESCEPRCSDGLHV